MSRYYLKILTLTNIIMLNISQVLLKFGFQSIPKIIIKQANKNTEYLEGCIK